MGGRTFAAVIAVDVLTGATWAYTTVLTSAGPAPLLPHLTLSPAGDCGQLASMVTGDTAALLAALAALNAACYLAAGLRARGKTRHETASEPDRTEDNARPAAAGRRAA